VCARLFVVCSSLSLLLFSIESTRLLFYKQEKQKKTEVDLLFLTYNSSEVYFEINHCMSIFHLEWNDGFDLHHQQLYNNTALSFDRECDRSIMSLKLLHWKVQLLFSLDSFSHINNNYKIIDILPENYCE